MVIDPEDNRSLGMGDAWTYYAPALHYMDHRIHDGEFPLWNPLSFCGHPFAADPQHLVFYPPNLIRSLLSFDPTPLKTLRGVAWMVFFHLLVQGFSTFFLARSHKLSHGASVTAALIYTLSAVSVSRCIGHWIFIGATAWTPLLLLVARKALIADGLRQRAAYTLGAGLVYGLIVLGGAPHLIVLTGFTLGCYCAVHAVLFVEKKHLRPLALGKRLAGHLAAPMVVALVGALASAALLLPLTELTKYSNRAGTAEKAEQGLKEAVGKYGDLFEQLAVYPGNEHYEGIKAAGAGCLFLAFLAILHRKKRVAVLYLALLLILFDCSMGEPLLFGRLLKWVSPYAMTAPSRAMLIACLPLALLAGLGVDGALAKIQSRRWKLARAVWIVSAAVLVLSVLIQGVSPHSYLDISKIVVVIPAVLCIVVLAAGWFHEPVIWAALIPLLLLGEAAVWNKEYLPYLMQRGHIYPSNQSALAKHREWSMPRERGVDHQPNLKLYDLTPVMNAYLPLHDRSVCDVLSPWSKMPFVRAVFDYNVTADGYRGHQFLKRFFWLSKQYVDGELPGRKTLFPATTTIFLKNPGNLSVPRVPAESLQRSSVSENTNKTVLLPRGDKTLTLDDKSKEEKRVLNLQPFNLPDMHCALGLVISTNSKMTLQPVFGKVGTSRVEVGKTLTLPDTHGREAFVEVPIPDFNKVKVIIRSESIPEGGRIEFHEISVACDLDDENKLIEVLSHTSNSAEIKLNNLPGPRLLTFMDADYPGWQAYLDGERVPILKGNNVFKTVEVPPGTHTVAFKFRPGRTYAGITISISTVLLVCAAMLLLSKRASGDGNEIEDNTR